MNDSIIERALWDARWADLEEAEAIRRHMETLLNQLPLLDV